MAGDLEGRKLDAPKRAGRFSSVVRRIFVLQRPMLVLLSLTDKYNTDIWTLTLLIYVIGKFFWNIP